jgi:hypothetical protein
MLVTDYYINVRILFGDDRGRRISVEPAFRKSDEDVVTFSGLLQGIEQSAGTFSITLVDGSIDLTPPAE